MPKNKWSEQQSTDHIECQRACQGKTWENRLRGVRWELLHDGAAWQNGICVYDESRTLPADDGRSTR